MAEWIAIIIAIGTVLYNTIVTHVVLKNDVKHLVKDVEEIKTDVRELRQCLLKKK